MNLLIVSQYFWPENFRINDLAAGLVERGHEVSVLTGIPNYPQGRFFAGYGYFKRHREIYKGVRIIRVPLIARGNGNGKRLALNYLSFAVIASICSPFFCNGKFDLIFVFEPSPITVGLPAIFLKHLKSIPIFFWVQDLWPESLSATGAVRSPLILKLVKKLVCFIYQRCDKILTTSQAYFPSIISLGIHSKKLIYFPQCVEELYQPVKIDPSSTEQTLIPEGFRVMFAGNIGTAQSFETIIGAANELRSYTNIQWVIIGDGRKRAWVETEVKRLKLTKTVHLLGSYPVEMMPRFFALADALLVTLKNEPIFSLTIPGKVQSYLACGKPIIAALEGEGSRLVREANAGLTCPAENPLALAETVLSMYHLPLAQREKLGQCGYQYHKANFARDILLTKLENWMYEATEVTRNEV